MSLWGKNDAASNAMVYAAAQFNKTPNTANRTALFGNTSANAFVTNETVGLYAVSDDEVAASRGSIAHSGWILRTEGTGGRAGRIQTEVLVAGGISGDASDDAVLPDYFLSFSEQPVSNTTVLSDGEISFNAAGLSAPTGATIAYQWYQSANGNVYVPAAAGTTGNTTGTLTVANNTPVDGYFYYVEISATGAANAVSDVVTVDAVTP